MPIRAHKASDHLRTPEDVAAYLNATMAESDGPPRLLMKAFRNVAAAQGGVSAIARKPTSTVWPSPAACRETGTLDWDGDEDRRGLRLDAAVRSAGGRHQLNIDGESRSGRLVVPCAVR